MKVAIGTQIYLPYTQSWIYRQIKGARLNVALVICNKKENLETFPFDQVEVIPEESLLFRKIRYKMLPVLKHLPYYVSGKKKRGYFEALKKNGIDLLHVHFGVMGVELMNVCERLNIPLIVTFHGFDITAAVQRDPAYYKVLLQLFDKMKVGIAISNEMKKRLIDLGCNADKIAVSYLGIPTNEFPYIDRSNAKDTVKFIHAGRLSATKGVPDLIRAFSKAFKQEDQVELFIIGDGEEKELVIDAIECSPVSNKIKYLGKLSNEELLHYRTISDVFVLNCRTPASGDKEGLPIALLEASSMGLPIVSTRHAGIAEGVLHEQTGLLVDEFDTLALSEAMLAMMDQSLRLKLGKQGRQWMEQQFDLESCNEVLYTLYEQTVSQVKDKAYAQEVSQEALSQQPHVALYVDDFLPYTHGWIYRQVSDPVTNVRTVLCHKRSEEKVFSIEHYVRSSNAGQLETYIRGRFWFLFKYFKSELSETTTTEFAKALRAREINLVHAHFGTNGVLIAPLCKQLQIPLMVTFHGFDISSAPLRWPAYRMQLASLFHQIVYAIAISEEMSVRLVEIGCPREKIKVSYLGVPLDEFPFVDRSNRNQPLIFLHAGRLTAKKGVPDLVRAFSQAFPESGEAELWLVGEGEEKEEIQRVMQSNGSSDVKLLGRLSEEELQQVRSEADVFVLNCRTDNAGTKEGLPISILEACCTGMPVISTYHAGIPEAIQDGVTGLLVKEYNNTALAEALQKMSDATKRLAMGKKARAFMEEKFSLAGCNEKLNILYKAALKR